MKYAQTYNPCDKCEFNGVSSRVMCEEYCEFGLARKKVTNKPIKGEWTYRMGYAGYGYYCSICDAVFTGVNAEWIAKGHDYCPKCGARMKGGDVNENRTD